MVRADHLIKYQLRIGVSLFVPDLTDAIIYLQNEYPVRSQTFVSAETEALRRRGERIVVVSCHRSSMPHSDAVPIVVLTDLPKLRTAYAHARMICRRPRQYIRLIRQVAARLESSAPWWLYAPLLAMDYNLARASHIHTHFATRAAAFGGVLADTFRIPRSVTTHAADIYMKNKHLTSQLSGAAIGTVTQFNQSHLLKLGFRDTHLVRCGVDMTSGEITPSERQTIDNLLHRDQPNQVLILSVGRLVEKKGHDGLIAAAGKLSQSGKSIRLIIVGDGPLREPLLRAAQSQQVNLHLIPQLPNAAVRMLMRGVDVFALACIESETGDADGLPVAILEAALERCPIVAGNVTGVSEFLDDQTGQLVPGQDIDCLVAALRTTVLDKEKTRGKVAKAHQRVVTEFSLQNQVESTERLFAIARGGFNFE